MTKNIIVGLLIVVLVGMAFVVLTGEYSRQQDLRDGGDAQVIRVEPPPLSLTPEYDKAYAEVYKTYAEGNKANAEGDAASTLANAQAAHLYNGAFMGWVGLGLFVLAIVIGVGFAKAGGG